jgi:hypothetical protein
MPGGAGSAAKIIQAGHHGLQLAAGGTANMKFQKFTGKRAPASATKGIYVSEFYATSNNIFGYPKNNSSNGPSICNESTAEGTNGIATDKSGNLIVPTANSTFNAGTITVFQGPGMCGAQVGSTITDNSTGAEPTDVASNDAINGTIVVGHSNGQVSTCTLASETCTELSTPPTLGTFIQVAMDKNGNCYADTLSSSATGTLIVYSGTPSAPCTGAGAVASGFTNYYYGGLDVDNRGNLVTISETTSAFGAGYVMVYSGCSTLTCSAVGGPFATQGQSIFGHLGRQNERFVTTDYSDLMVEVYAYTPGGTGLTYMYSFNNGLSCATDACEGAAYSPSSKGN